MDAATLLLPCAGRSSRFPDMRPKWMLTAPDGMLMVEKASQSVFPAFPKRVVVGILQEHVERYRADKVLKRSLLSSADIVVLEKPTGGPAETVYEMIRKGHIDGPIWVKDADTFLEFANALEGQNCVATFDIRKHPAIASVGGKSFAVVNEQNHVVDIIEKSVCSNYVSAGLYGFCQAAAYVRFYEDLQESSSSGEVFVSHVISQAIAHGDIFTNVEVRTFIDAGTAAEWRRYCAPFSTYLVDLDGVVFINQSKYFEPLWDEKETPIKENVDALLSLQRKGAQFIFVTARPEKYREKTAAALNTLGLIPHALIMECLHGTRFLINDYATTNPYPSAISINLERNSRNLKTFLPEPV